MLSTSYSLFTVTFIHYGCQLVLKITYHQTNIFLTFNNQFFTMYDIIGYLLIIPIASNVRRKRYS